MKEGYYSVKFYNHIDAKIIYWNGSQFESFKSDKIPHDEIDWSSVKQITP